MHTDKEDSKRKPGKMEIRGRKEEGCKTEKIILTESTG
jgi:hypothetical protein